MPSYATLPAADYACHAYAASMPLRYATLICSPQSLMRYATLRHAYDDIIFFRCRCCHAAALLCLPPLTLLLRRRHYFHAFHDAARQLACCC